MAKEINVTKDAQSVASTSTGAGLMVGGIVGLWQGFKVNERIARGLGRLGFAKNFFSRWGVAPVLFVLSIVMLFLRKKASVYERFVYVAVLINSAVDVIKGLINKGE